jgi:NADPH:quinone reductase-like Zn-dependent oxidoreductase
MLRICLQILSIFCQSQEKIKMKLYQLQSHSGLDALTLMEQSDPQPGVGQILVQVRATALNYRDLIIANGQNPAIQYPVIPLSDGAGDVVAIGEGVTRVKVGDRVAGTFFQGWQAGEMHKSIMKSALGGEVNGMLAEYVVLNQEGVVMLPDHLSYEEGATLPCAAVTAWHGLVSKGHLKAGDTVLALGTGGVSIFALQFAKLQGARVMITSSSDEKLRQARALGADETINYKTHPDWEAEVYRLTHSMGVDHVVEVGGAGTLEKSIKSVRYGGQIHLIGVLTGFAGEINPWLLVAKSISLHGIYVGSREMFETMNRAIAQAHLKPVIDRVFPFTEARAAYDYLQSGAHFGKIVIRVS